MRLNKDSFYQNALIKDYERRYGEAGRVKALEEIERAGRSFIALDTKTSRAIKRYKGDIDYSKKFRIKI